MRTVWLANRTIVPVCNARIAGFSTAWRVSSWTIWNTSVSKMPEGVGLRPAGQRLRDGVHGGHATLGIGGDHGVADTGERDAKPFRLLPQCVLGAPARDENALSILQGDVAKPCLFVAVGGNYVPFIRSLASARAASWFVAAAASIRWRGRGLLPMGSVGIVGMQSPADAAIGVDDDYSHACPRLTHGRANRGPRWPWPRPSRTQSRPC